MNVVPGVDVSGQPDVVGYPVELPVGDDEDSSGDADVKVVPDVVDVQVSDEDGTNVQVVPGLVVGYPVDVLG